MTWEWNGLAITAPSGSDLDLGTFTVLTDLSQTPTPFPTPLNYLGSVDGTTESNSGVVTVTTIPEPSSVILLFLGAVCCPCTRTTTGDDRPMRHLGNRGTVLSPTSGR